MPGFVSSASSFSFVFLLIEMQPCLVQDKVYDVRFARFLRQRQFYGDPKLGPSMDSVTPILVIKNFTAPTSNFNPNL